MQWDRIAIIAVAILASLYTGYYGWQDMRKGRYLAVAGHALAIVAAITVSTVLALVVD